MSGDRWWNREYEVSPAAYFLISLWSMVLAAAMILGLLWLIVWAVP